MSLLKGKIAVVTGANSGLGRTLAIEFAKRGAIVVINYRKTKGAALVTLKKVKTFSPKSIIFRADVSKENEVNKMFSLIKKKFRRVDILINNVGNFYFGPFSKMSANQFRDVMESNLYGTLYCSRAALKFMRRQKSGNIINIGCAACERVVLRKNTAVYYHAKNGAYVLTKLMAAEEKKRGIRVNIISPGIMENSVVLPKGFKGKVVRFKKIADAMLKLISDKSANGRHVQVLGGWKPKTDILT
ncbi:TPA: SDR family oxidoreductase [archaeon]|nr:SDR family oxidoreductase [Candidatus Naiadarchaeales archaeon SRR2090153.bin461]